MLAESGGWFNRRVLPYLTADRKIEGVVVTFTDITDLKRAEQRASTAQASAENIVDTVREPLVILDDRQVVVSANRAFYQFFAVTAASAVGQRLRDVHSVAFDALEFNALIERLLADGEPVEGVETRLRSGSGDERLVVLNAREVRHEAPGRPTDPGSDGGYHRQSSDQPRAACGQGRGRDRQQREIPLPDGCQPRPAATAANHAVVARRDGPPGARRGGERAGRGFRRRAGRDERYDECAARHQSATDWRHPTDYCRFPDPTHVRSHPQRVSGNHKGERIGIACRRRPARSCTRIIACSNALSRT